MTDQDLDTHAGERTATGAWRWLRAVIVAVCAGGVVAWWAAAQLDSSLAGQPVRFGFWSAFWGGAVTVIGFGVGASGSIGRAVVVSAIVLLAGLVVAWVWVVGGFSLTTS